MKSRTCRRSLRIISLSLIALLCGCNDDPIAGTAIHDVTVIDAENGVRNNQTVIFVGDEIVSVMPAKNAPKTTTVIDGRGKYLIPGLWDMHVHLTYDDNFTEKMPEMFLEYGVTSVRDTGGLMDKLLPVIERMRAVGAIAPRVFFSGPLLDGEHVVYDGLSQPEIGTSNGDVEIAARNVTRLKEQGVDFIKIYELVSPDVFAALVATAKKHKLPIAAHIPLSTLASESGPMVGSMEHLRNIEMDCAENAIELLATRRQRLEAPDIASGSALRWSMHSLQRLAAIEANDSVRCEQVLLKLSATIQVPTARLNALPLISPKDRPDWRQALRHLPTSVPAEWQNLPEWIAADPADRDTRYAEWSMDMINQMNTAGIRIGAGTDTPLGVAIPGYSLHNELDVLVKAGLTPMEAIRSATITPAEFLSMDDEIGTISSGKRADLVLLTANPLNDIRNTRMIELVVSKGRVLSSKLND